MVSVLKVIQNLELARNNAVQIHVGSLRLYHFHSAHKKLLIDRLDKLQVAIDLGVVVPVADSVKF